MNIKFITGNFDLAIEGEFSEDQREKALEAAARYIVQRDVASAAYKSLLGKGDKRDSLEFNEENSAAFEKEFETALEKYGTFTVAVSEHVPSEGAASPMKRATTLVDTFLGTEQEAGYRAILGLPDGDRDALIAKANAMGLGISAPRTKKESAEA